MSAVELFVRANSALFHRLSEDDPAATWQLCLPPGCGEEKVSKLIAVYLEPLVVSRLCTLRRQPLLRSLGAESDADIHELHHIAEFLQLPIDTVCRKLRAHLAAEKQRLHAGPGTMLACALLADVELGRYFDRTKLLLDVIRLPHWISAPLRRKSRIQDLLCGLCGDSLVASVATAEPKLGTRVAWLSGFIAHSWLAGRLVHGSEASQRSAVSSAVGGAGCAAVLSAEETSPTPATSILTDAEGAAIGDGPIHLLAPVFIATYLGRLQWLRALVDAGWPLRHRRFQVDCVLFAAAGGQLAALDWLTQCGGKSAVDGSMLCRWTPQCARLAARNGHVHVLAWAHERGLMGVTHATTASACLVQAAVGAAEGASEAALRWLLHAGLDVSGSCTGSRSHALAAAGCAVPESTVHAAELAGGTGPSSFCTDATDERHVLHWRLPRSSVNGFADPDAASFDVDWGVEDAVEAEEAEKAEEADGDAADSDGEPEAYDEHLGDDEDLEDCAAFKDGGGKLVEAAAAAAGAPASARLSALRCLVMEARCSVTANALMAAAELGDIPSLDFLLHCLLKQGGSGCGSGCGSGSGSGSELGSGPLDPEACQGVALAAAANGHASVLQWLADQGYLASAVSSSVMRAAVGSGNIGLLERLRKCDPPCPWGTGLVALARRKGRADVVAWLRSAGYPATPAEDTHLVM